LAEKIPRFKTCLRKSRKGLGKDAIEKRSLEDQFEMLILNPLTDLFPDDSASLTRIIVIDALDECEQPGHISQILSLFSQLRKVNSVRLRMFLTSRSDPRIVEAFGDLEEKQTAYCCLSLLGKNFTNETRTDISAFLEDRFKTIKRRRKVPEEPWPKREDLDRLITLATNPSPLFIYADTLCRFVDKKIGGKNPVNLLKFWLDKSDSNASNFTKDYASQINQIYKPILQILFGTDQVGNSHALDSDDKEKLLHFLGSIILLATPLPAKGLATLIGMKEYDCLSWLDNLHAVLDVPPDHKSPIRLLHKSFSDFLLGQEGTGIENFRVDATKTHAMLALRCIQRMSHGLREDICDIRELGKSRSEIGKGIVADHIPPDLDYACLYWVFHFQQSRRRITDGDVVHAFLKEHFLHWLEALGLIGKISESNGMIGTLQSLIAVS
jgi:hypothetical protein